MLRRPRNRVVGAGRWRLVGGLVVGLLLLSACTGGGSQTAQPTATTTTAPTGVVATAGECGQVEGNQRIVDHAMGQTRVPLDPQRVVVLDTGELDSALALGVTPVGAVTAFADGPFPTYLLDRTATIQRVGTISQPNLEAIAALNPDLILSNTVRHEDIYDQLSAIAPTVMAESVGVAWKDNLRLDAVALGRCQQAEELFDRYEQRLARFREVMGDRLEKTTVSVVRSMPDEVRIYMQDSFIGTVLEDAGLPRPAPQNKDVFMEEATLERIPDLDGDVMFVTRFGEDDAAFERLRGSPLWGRLSVVRSGRVYEVPDGRWMLGIGMLAANEVVDDLFGYLVE